MFRNTTKYVIYYIRMFQWIGLCIVQEDQNINASHVRTRSFVIVFETLLRIRRSYPLKGLWDLLLYTLVSTTFANKARKLGLSCSCRSLIKL